MDSMVHDFHPKMTKRRISTYERQIPMQDLAAVKAYKLSLVKPVTKQTQKKQVQDVASVQDGIAIRTPKNFETSEPAVTANSRAPNEHAIFRVPKNVVFKKISTAARTRPYINKRINQFSRATVKKTQEKNYTKDTFDYEKYERRVSQMFSDIVFTYQKDKFDYQNYEINVSEKFSDLVQTIERLSQEKGDKKI